MGRKKKVIKKAVLNLPSASESIDRQKALWEKYHGDQQESIDSTIKPVQLRKIINAETTKRDTSKKRRLLKANARIESEQNAEREYNRALDATRGTHIHKHQIGSADYLRSITTATKLILRVSYTPGLLTSAF